MYLRAFFATFWRLLGFDLRPRIAQVVLARMIAQVVLARMIAPVWDWAFNQCGAH
jgi:hypothetical protein